MVLLTTIVRGVVWEKGPMGGIEIEILVAPWSLLSAHREVEESTYEGARNAFISFRMREEMKERSGLGVRLIWVVLPATDTLDFTPNSDIFTYFQPHCSCFLFVRFCFILIFFYLLPSQILLLNLKIYAWCA
jgi:hypothetical protein